MSPPSKPTFGAAPPFAPRPQPSSYTTTPIFNQPLEEDEPQVIKSVTPFSPPLSLLSHIHH